jgi:RNA polymerase sigma-70 factor (ECF subfamily)
VLALYDALLKWRDDAVVRLNRAVAVAEVTGPAQALAEVDWLDSVAFRDFGPFHAVRADLLARLGRGDEAVAAYDRALALDPAPAERLWLERRRGQAAMR